jgi:hypothetical protein
MSDADDKFVHATDSLLALYRSVERSTLDLPVVSFMPMLIFIWAALRFYFFLVTGLVLIIPINLVILIRNIFPGHWRYRPFFLSHLYYVWLWIWRGEVPTFPLIFFRPLLSIFIKARFETRLRRLRLEILDSELSDGTRSTLLGRLDAALERWKSPRTGAIFYTVILPGIISLPAWYKQLIEFLYHLHNGLNRVAWLVFSSPRCDSLAPSDSGETDGQMQQSRGAAAENCVAMEDIGPAAPTHPDGAVA